MSHSKSGQWLPRTTRAKQPLPDDIEKAHIIATSDAFIRDVVKPRFLPEIISTQFNYPIDIFGVWAGGRYRFMERYRSGFPDNAGEEFDAPYARLNYTGRDRFDIYWMRHTGKWWLLFQDVSLAVALKIPEEDSVMHPIG